MRFNLSKDELEQMNDENLGQHFRYMLGESEYVSDSQESNEDADDIDEQDGQDVISLDDTLVDDLGMPRRMTVEDMKKMSDSNLGKLMRSLIERRLLRKPIEVVVYTDSEDLDTEDLANKDSANEDKSYTLKNVAVFATGTYKNKKWGVDHLKRIVANFKKFAGQITPPLKIGHGKQPDGDKGGKVEQPAFGWIQALRLKGSKLYADITDIPKAVYDAMVKKRYKRVSSEIYLDFTDEKGKSHGPALAAVALLGSTPPAVKNLPEIVAKYDAWAEINQSEEFEFDLAQEIMMADLESADTEGGIDTMPEKDETTETTDNVDEETDEDNEKGEKEEPKSDTPSTEAAAPSTADFAKILKENEALRVAIRQLEEGRKEDLKSRRHSEEKLFVETLKKDGKILPAKETLIYNIFDAVADVQETIKFSEQIGDQTVEIETTAYDLFKRHLTELPIAVDFSERSKGDKFEEAEVPAKSAGEPALKKNEEWVGQDLHARIEKFLKENPEKVKEYAEKMDVSEYEAAMDLVGSVS